VNGSSTIICISDHSTSAFVEVVRGPLVMPEIAAFSERIANSTMAEAIARGGELWLITHLIPTMHIFGRWHLQGQCKSNCCQAADHGLHQPPSTYCVVSGCIFLTARKVYPSNHRDAADTTKKNAKNLASAQCPGHAS
jgi:hypothetical protein